MDDAEHFDWHGLHFEWRSPEKRFDNYKQEQRWAHGTLYPIGKRWSCTMTCGSCSGQGDGATAEEALDAAFGQMERDIAVAREHMRPGSSPEWHAPACAECGAPAKRAYRNYGSSEEQFYCDYHADARIVAEMAKWRLL